jgi:hypothetical protein
MANISRPRAPRWVGVSAFICRTNASISLLVETASGRALSPVATGGFFSELIGIVPYPSIISAKSGFPGFRDAMMRKQRA